MTFFSVDEAQKMKELSGEIKNERENVVKMKQLSAVFMSPVIGHGVTNCKHCFRCYFLMSRSPLSSRRCGNYIRARWNHFPEAHFFINCRSCNRRHKIEMNFVCRSFSRTEDWRQNFRSISGDSEQERTTIGGPLFLLVFMVMTVVTHCTQHFSLVRKLILTS